MKLHRITAYCAICNKPCSLNTRKTCSRKCSLEYKKAFKKAYRKTDKYKAYLKAYRLKKRREKLLSTNKNQNVKGRIK